jgi:hypothetical protein
LAGVLVVQTICELEVVTDPVCTFVMTRVDAGGGLLALLTKPEQPLKSAAEQLRITAPTVHTHPLTIVFTFLISSGLLSAR